MTYIAARRRVVTYNIGEGPEAVPPPRKGHASGHCGPAVRLRQVAAPQRCGRAKALQRLPDGFWERPRNLEQSKKLERPKNLDPPANGLHQSGSGSKFYSTDALL